MTLPLFERDVLIYPNRGIRRRVLKLLPKINRVVMIDIDAETALPEFESLNEVCQDIAEKNIGFLDPRDEAQLWATPSPGERALRLSANAWVLISPLVHCEPDIYFPSTRSKLILERIAEAGGTHKTIYKNLRRWWQRGMTPQALLPDFKNCGAKGKARQPADGKFLGRPPVLTTDRFVMARGVTDILKVAMARFWEPGSKFKLLDALDFAHSIYGNRKVLALNDNMVRLEHVEPKELSSIFTMRQFVYWAKKEYPWLEKMRKRIGERIYDKDMRGKIGTTTFMVEGPGGRFQIDATVADVYLVSVLNRSVIVGRPTVYLVICQKTQMRCGLYIGFERPSWTGAMLALANCAEDKVSYCTKFGVEIAFEDWPCAVLPKIVEGDKGEMASLQADCLVKYFAVDVETPPAYRPDLKGIVESGFKTFHLPFGPYVPGFVQADFEERGARDYRLDAVFNIVEFTRYVILNILLTNNYNPMRRYDRDKEMAEDNVAAVPRDLWNWGLEHQTGELRRFDTDIVKFRLMPTGRASVTESGIYFCHAFYACDFAMESRWFDRARQSGSWRVTVSYDPRLMDNLYLHDETGKALYHICSKTLRSRATLGLSYAEIELHHRLQKRGDAEKGKVAAFQRQLITATMENLIDRLVEEKKSITTTATAGLGERIRQNREVELRHEREHDTWRLGGNAATPRPASLSGTENNVVPFPTKQQDDFAAPSLNDILGDTKNDQ